MNWCKWYAWNFRSLVSIVRCVAERWIKRTNDWLFFLVFSDNMTNLLFIFLFRYTLRNLSGKRRAAATAAFQYEMHDFTEWKWPKAKVCIVYYLFVELYSTLCVFFNLISLNYASMKSSALLTLDNAFLFTLLCFICRLRVYLVTAITFLCDQLSYRWKFNVSV